MLNYYNFWKSGDQKLLKDLCVLILRDSLDLKGTVNYILSDFISVSSSPEQKAQN